MVPLNVALPPVQNGSRWRWEGLGGETRQSLLDANMLAPFRCRLHAALRVQT
jgi:hypothetical protein